MEKEKKKYPIAAGDYELYEIIGEGSSAVVHRAFCKPLDEIVAIKITDCERDKTDLNNISREAKTMLLVDHPNLLNAHCSFIDGHYLWVVMPYLAGGSCFHLMKWAFPKGFLEEGVIAYFLREALKGLEYLHQHGHIHRDVKAGNILVDTNGSVKLGDFGVSAYLFDAGDRQRTRNTFVGTPCWMAPEVVDPQCGYDYKADIWSFGITALELAHGHAPFSSQPPMKVFLMTLQNAPPSLDNKSDKRFSRSFKHMIAMCLVKDPSKRPTAAKLLKQQFFKHSKSPEYVVRKILQGLPNLGDRFQALKLKDEELLSQKRIYDLEEKRSKSEYHRGISSWNFDVEDLKLQASLISESDDSIPGKDSDGCSSCSGEISSSSKVIPQHSARTLSLKDDCDWENDAMMQEKPAFAAPHDCSAKLHRKSEQFPDASCNGSTCPKTYSHNGEAPESIGGVTDEQPKVPVVQQKGRFKVTSENVDMENAHSSNGTSTNYNHQSNAAKEREKELKENIADLQSRLSSAKDELKKLKDQTS